MWRRLTAALLTGVMLLGVGSAALASGAPIDLVATSPPDGATVASASVVSATYSGPLHRSNSRITLLDAAGNEVPGRKNFADGDTTILFTPVQSLAFGSYRVDVLAKSENVPAFQTTATWRFTVAAPQLPAPTIVSVAGNPTPPALGSDATPTVVVAGVAPGDTVSLLDAGVQVATLPATGVSVTFNAGATTDLTLAEGSHTLTAVRAVLANVSDPSPVFVYTLDVTAPGVPVIASVEGQTSSPAVGNDVTPTVQVSAVAGGDTVRLFDGAAQVAAKVVPGSALTSVTFNVVETDTELTVSGDGPHHLTATATDPAGNTSTASVAFVYHLSTDAQPPQLVSTSPVDGGVVAAPSIVSATFDEVLDPRVSTISLSASGGSVPGTAAFSADLRTVLFVPDVPLTASAGTYTVTAVVQDPNGNTTTTTWTFSISLVTLPGAPTVASVDGDTSSPGLTNDPTPAIVVSDVALGDTVTLFDAGLQVANSVATGTSVTFNAGAADDVAFTEGPHALTATRTNTLGATSSASAVFVVTLDVSAPAAPVITSIEGQVTSPAVGNDPTPTVTLALSGEAGTLRVFDGNAEVAQAGVGAGATSFVLNPLESDAELTVSGEGPHTLTASFTDGAGNSSSVSASFVYHLSTDHQAPQLVSTSPADGATVNAPAIVSATFDEVVDPRASSISLTTAGGDPVAGTVAFSADLHTVLFVPGATLTAVDSPYQAQSDVSDPNGNVASVTWSFSVRGDSPTAPPTIASVDGDATSPALGTDATPAVVVTGVSGGQTVRLLVGAVEKAAKVVPASATSITFNAGSAADVTLTADDLYQLTATATDVSGTSQPSAPFEYTLDTTAPIVVVASVADDTSSPAVGASRTPTIVVSGTSAGDLVSLLEGGVVKATRTAAGSSVTFNAPGGPVDVTLTGYGQHQLTTRATDPAGNVGNPSPVFVYTLVVSFDGDPATTERISGDPTQSAIAISQARFGDGAAPYVVLSRDDVFADALASSPLVSGGPLLFTPSASLSTATKAEIRRVLPRTGKVYLLGGEVALTPAVEQALRDDGYTDITRFPGVDRIHTALLVADEVLVRFPGSTRVGLARASGPGTAAWADSVTGGAWAAEVRMPMLITPTDTLDARVASWLSSHHITQTVIFGGPVAISVNVENAVPGPVRKAGDDRAGTAAKIATDLWQVAPTGPRRFIIVNGVDPLTWMYGLASAGLAADSNAPVLMVGPTDVPPATAALVKSCGSPQVDLLIVEPTTIVSEAVRTQLDTLDGQGCS